MNAGQIAVPALSLAFLAAVDWFSANAGVAGLEKLCCPMLSASLLLLLLAEPLFVDKATVFTASRPDMLALGLFSPGTDKLLLPSYDNNQMKNTCMAKSKMDISTAVMHSSNVAQLDACTVHVPVLDLFFQVWDCEIVSLSSIPRCPFLSLEHQLRLISNAPASAS